MLRTVLAPDRWIIFKALVIGALIILPPWEIMSAVSSQILATHVYSKTEIINWTTISYVWIISLVIISYILFTRRLIRDTWNSQMAFILMWIFYSFSIIYSIILYIDIPNEDFKLTEPGEPLFGLVLSQ
jgi:hypothetical protein